MSVRLKEKSEELDLKSKVEILAKQKEELEEEFTEILKFVLDDLKNQEEVMQNILETSVSDNAITNTYKEKYNEAMNEVNKLKKELEVLKNKYNKLAGSKLGKITLKYWRFKNR